jgi:hypothetical protein
MHNLQAERFFKPKMINGMMASADGPIKTLPRSAFRRVRESSGAAGSSVVLLEFKARTHPTALPKKMRANRK